MQIVYLFLETSEILVCIIFINYIYLDDGMKKTIRSKNSGREGPCCYYIYTHSRKNLS